MNRFILAIDPGNVKSAFCLVDPELKPLAFGKNDNELMYAQIIDDIVKHVPSEYIDHGLDVAIEMMQSFGAPVGKTTFETCVWIGQLKERFRDFEPVLIYRKSDENMTLCHRMTANDSQIKRVLIDRFAPNTPNYGKGTKKEPGWFYGFRADIWQAYAVAVTFHDKYLKGDTNE